MASRRTVSKIALRPRAPVFFAIDFFAIKQSAASVKCSLTWKHKLRRTAFPKPKSSTCVHTYIVHAK